MDYETWKENREMVRRILDMNEGVLRMNEDLLGFLSRYPLAPDGSMLDKEPGT